MSVNKVLVGVDIFPCPMCKKKVLRHFTNINKDRIWIECFKCRHKGPEAGSLRGAMLKWSSQEL